MTQDKKQEPRKIKSACDSCIHFVYDEGYMDYACEVALDEDEMNAFLGGRTAGCHYYKFYDEYKSVHKQI